MLPIRPIVFLIALAPLAPGQDRAAVEPKSLPAPDQPVAPVTPPVEQLDESRFRIGEVTFDKKTREIRFPAQVNMTEGLLEFLVVHKNGKLHESLFFTEASPLDLNLAFTLLRYKPSRELYPLPSATGGASTNFPDVPAETKAAARVDIFVEWTEDGKTRRLPANDLVQHEVKAVAMPPGPWVYGGSDIHDGKFIAETTGDVIAIYLAMSALVNYPGEDRSDDTVWIPFTNRVPPEGTKVTVIIAPHRKPQPPDSP